MSVSLKISNVSKVYDKNIALNNINLDIQKGEFVCLLGPSGCGKSTLLRMIAGLDMPDNGNVYIDSRDVTRLSPSRRNFGIMFQSYALFPNLTAYDNVAYGLSNKKIRTRDIHERVDRLFEMIKLTDAKNRLPAELSGGEQQRVALARALSAQPDFLLLDEPLSALDAKVRIELRRQICDIQREMGLTTIMVTHDQEEALTMADRIIVMNKAVVMQEGTPEEIYQQPKNPFVADFIGSINFMEKEHKEIFHTEEELSAIRPEKIQITRNIAEDNIHGIIMNIEFRGSFYRVNTKVTHMANDQLNLFVDVPFTAAKDMKLQTGESVYLKLPREEILHFQTA